MPTKILMPALSPTMTEGNLVKWHKKEGDAIKSGQLLVEIETDKATMEVEAVDEGILGKILVAEGTENVQVNALIGVILETGEDASALDAFISANTTSAPAAEPQDINTATSAVANSAPVTAAATSTPHTTSERVFASPLAKRIAGQQDVELSNIEGTGPRGRIVKADVEKFIASGSATASNATATANIPQFGPSGFVDINLNSMRKTIAKRLTEAKQTIPHFYLTIDCELDALLALRTQLNQLNEGVKLSVNDLVIRACALALKAVPQANATYHDTYVRQYEAADVAVAVAIDGGLVTPIIRSANQKSLSTISTEMKALAERARAGKLKPEEYQGGGFSLSNLGMFGVKQFGAIINPPQASILAVGAGEKRAIVKDNQVVMATVMSCTLSVDHRAIDGAVGARWLAAFKEAIEQPLRLLV